jgi:hypothetical protein
MGMICQTAQMHESLYLGRSVSWPLSNIGIV